MIKETPHLFYYYANFLQHKISEAYSVYFRLSSANTSVIVAVYSIAIVTPLEISSPEGIGYSRTARNLSIKSR